MKRRILLGGLAVGAFMATLAFSFWHEGLWHSAEEPATAAAPQPDKDNAVPTGLVAASPADPSPEVKTAALPGPAVPAAVNPPAAIAPAEAPPGDPQYEQVPNPGVDPEAIRRDRGVQHTTVPN